MVMWLCKGMEEGGDAADDHVWDSRARFGRNGSLLRGAGRGILQRYVFAVAKFVATQQLRPRLPPETSKALITTHAGRLT